MSNQLARRQKLQKARKKY